ncbi:MAG: beta-glucanase (GH16 family) [Arenicella sp.]|jgi:beta-glucanase (GH16 family)
MKYSESKFSWFVALAAIVSIGFTTPALATKSKQDKAEKRHLKKLKKAGWREVWADEFNASQIDLSNWSHEVNCQGGGNNEQQCYTARAANSFVADGKLHIVAKEEAFSGPAQVDDDPSYDPNDTSVTLPFTSARLRSKGKADFTYGRMEIRSKLAAGQGMWPAIWMLPTDSVYGGWPSSGEIDIMEAVNLGTGAPNEIFGTLHYGLKWPQWEIHGAPRLMDANPADDFHVYAIEWDEDEIRWYVDGEHYQTQNSEGWYNYIWQGQQTGFGVANPRAPFDQNFHMILNLAVGGGLPGNPDINWPQDRNMLVDYVRVYECKKARKGKHKHNHKGKDKHDHKGKHNHKHKGKGKKSRGCSIVDDTVQLNAGVGAPAISDFLIFSDGVETLDLGSVSNTVVPGHFDNETGLVSQSVSDVWDIYFGGAGNVFLTAEDMSDVEGFDTGVNLAGGYGWANNGEIEFDMLVVNAEPDSQFTVKLDSGWPNLGEKIIDMPPIGEWQHVAVSVADLLANPNPNGGGVNLSDVLNLFVLDYSGSGASVQLDNIRLQCAVNSEPEPWQLDPVCSIAPKVASVAPSGDMLDIYIDAVTDWNIFDCCGGSSIAEIDLGGNNVLEFTYDSDPGTNTVTFFQPPAPVDLSSFAGGTNVAGGTIEFDMLVVSQPTNPAATPWLIKVDCDSGCSTGDRPITDSVEGVLPATGVWQHYTFNLDTLVAQGLDLSATSALVIFPAWGNQDNAVYQLDNVKVNKGSGGDGSNATVPVNFEDPNVTYNFSDFEGGVASVVGNPDISAANSSANVGRMVKFAGQVYGGSSLALGSNIDFSGSSVFSMNVWASRAVPVLLKLEGLNQEVTATHSGSGAWEELTFDFSGLAGSGANAITLIFDLGVAGDAGNNPADWTFYFDDISLNTGDGNGVCGTGTGTGASGASDGPLSLRAGSGLTFSDFGGGFTAIEIDPVDASNTVASTTKTASAELWSGLTFNDGLITYPMSVAESQISVRVYSPDAGIPVRLKLEDAADPTLTVETEAVTTVCGSWETLTFDFNNVAPGTNPFNPATTFNKSSIFFNFGATGAAAGEKTYLWDAIEFVGAGGGGGDATEPTAAAPTPTTGASNVISLFSDAYTDISNIDYNPNWGQATLVTQTPIDGNNTLKYADLNYQGTDFASNPQDVSAMTSLHLDFWTADSSALNVYLISAGPSETAFALPSTTGSWVSVDIPLTAFSGVDLTNIIQLKFDGNGTIFLDNVYFTNGDGGDSSGGELTSNGDFETGDKTGWAEFTTGFGGGSFTVENTLGSWAGKLVAGFNESPVIKQANIGIGTVAPNTSVTIEFDLNGSLIGDGGVVFAEFFSELSGGGTSKAEILSGGPLTPSNNWTRYTFTTTTGNDVSGGVTLQLKAACGPVTGCGVDASFDNASVTIN